jgi:hypothetical protein
VISILVTYSFITNKLVDLALDLYRLVHLATWNWLRKEDLFIQSTERAIGRLEEVFLDDDHINRSIWRTYLPHVRYALELDVVNKDGERRITLV